MGRAIVRSPNREVENHYQRPQIEQIMWIVERPDHHCGDDLVQTTHPQTYKQIQVRNWSK